MGLAALRLRRLRASATGRARQLLKRAIDKFQLLDPGETAIVAVSGGPDSLCLLHLLNWHNQRYHRNWQLKPVHVDPGFAGWRTDRVERACERIGLPCLVKTLDLPASREHVASDNCFLCARERRKSLFRTARDLGARKICLAHHLEDVNETFLLNLIFSATSSTFIPRQELFEGAVILVRPLYYVDKPTVTACLRQAGIRAIRNRCPYEKRGSRLMVRRFLEGLYRRDKRIRANIFWGLHNLRPPYLPRRPGHG